MYTGNRYVSGPLRPEKSTKAREKQYMGSTRRIFFPRGMKRTAGRRVKTVVPRPGMTKMCFYREEHGCLCPLARDGANNLRATKAKRKAHFHLCRPGKWLFFRKPGTTLGMSRKFYTAVSLEPGSQSAEQKQRGDAGRNRRERNLLKI